MLLEEHLYDVRSFVHFLNTQILQKEREEDTASNQANQRKKMRSLNRAYFRVQAENRKALTVHYFNQVLNSR